MSETPHSTSPSRADAICPARRRLLAAAGGISVAAVLTACGNDFDDLSLPANGGATAGTGGGAGTGGDAGGGGGVGNDGGAGGGDADSPTGEALAATSDIPVGGGKVINGLLVMQPEPGRFRAFDAACPHQGVQVSPPRNNGEISCSAHGSKFDEQGQVTNGPAQKGLTRRQLRVRNGQIFTA